MNSLTVDEDPSVTELVIKLCKHLSPHNDTLQGKLVDRALRLLNQAARIRLSAPSDEPFIASQLRETIKGKCPRNLEKFDLSYSNLNQSNVLKDRTAILIFLYSLSSLDKPLKTLGGKLERIDSQESASLKHIYRKKYCDTVSTIGRATSQATTISSAAWSLHDIATSSKATIPHAVTERDLVQDIIYSLQGIQGTYLRREPGNLGYTLDPKQCKGLSIVQRSLLDRLTGMSFLHMQLKNYGDKTDVGGAMGQAFVSILKSELSDYYRAIALLQSCLNADNTTLRGVLYIIHDHRVRFEWLAYVAEQAENKKGGALVTVVHEFLQHGSKTAQELAKKVLTAVCKPLYIMLSRWLLDGEINDPHNEFFIEAKNVVAAERLWHDKYNVRKSMVPSFITIEQARRMLATGKSINFLRQICKDGGQLPGREALQKLFKTASAEALFTPEKSIEFHSTLEHVYKETSLRVLDLLRNNFQLYEHLQSLRRYLLLGQGDFILHFVELLSPELIKPAGEIAGHTLSGILESAVRVTNAQFEDEDTLRRLNVSFMNHSIGDIGWDVFSLVYIIDGPIGTIFQSTMPLYQSLFGALWKAKRAEFVLANMRRQQLSMAKIFRKIRELHPVMHTIHMLTSRMIHFIHETQYYFLFEVLECSWAEMLTKVNKAECLDDIIKAHSEFLNAGQKGVLLDEQSRPLFSHLVSIYNFVINLESHQDAIYQASTDEAAAFVKYRSLADCTSDGFQINSEIEQEARERVAKFHHFLNTSKLKVRSTVDTYDIIVRKFLQLLAASSNMKLQLLSDRISFNGYYKLA